MQSHTRDFFGGEGPAITLPQAREFSMDNVDMRNKFIRELRKIHHHQRLPQRILELEKEFGIAGANPLLIERYNKLDKEISYTQHPAIRRDWIPIVSDTAGSEKHPHATETSALEWHDCK